MLTKENMALLHKGVSALFKQGVIQQKDYFDPKTLDHFNKYGNLQK